jgi:hypothetical protein
VNKAFDPELLRSPEIAEEVSTVTSAVMANILQDVMALRVDPLDQVGDRVGLLDKEEIMCRYLTLAIICAETPSITQALAHEIGGAKEILDQLLGDKDERLEIMELFKKFS